jgi:hypothetical protein
VRGLHLISIGQVCNNGFVDKLYIGDGGAGSVEVACCTRVQNCPFVDVVHVNVDCAKKCGGGKCTLGGDQARR